MLMQLPAKDGKQTREQFLDPQSTHSLFGNFGRHSQEQLKLRVQGRELAGLRFVQEMGRGGGADAQGTGPGATLVLDLTPEDGERPLVLQMTRADGGEDPFDTQAAVEFLEPFHVGSER